MHSVVVLLKSNRQTKSCRTATANALKEMKKFPCSAAATEEVGGRRGDTDDAPSRRVCVKVRMGAKRYDDVVGCIH
jgi:hypothetical protein